MTGNYQTVLVFLLLSVFTNQTSADDLGNYPTWSWDKVPVYLHFGSQTQLTDDQVERAAKISNFICLEKAHGRHTNRDHPERIMAEDARRLRQANPHAKVLMYWNTLIAWPFTSYNQQFAETHPENWTLRDKSSGEPLLKSTLGDIPVYQYNLLNSETRKWWVSTAGGAVSELGFDGLYMDAISQSRRPILLNKGWGRDSGEDLDQAAIEMMKNVRAEMGEDRLLIFNGFRTHAGVADPETQGGYEFLPYADGAKIEHFDQLGSATKEDILLNWQMSERAAAEGKIVIYKAWPDHAANFTNADFMKQSLAEREAFAREKIKYPLACFLIGAQRHAYFCYGWGYNVDDGQLIDYPEFDRRLGAPEGNARRIGESWVFTRRFEHALVRVDLEKREANIVWKDIVKQVDTEEKEKKADRPDITQFRKQVRELDQLSGVPQVYSAESFATELADTNVKPIFFEGLTWKGKPTRVFAWLGLPNASDRVDGGKVPGVVLVHGGGGTAFKEWVEKWNKNGFAAISIAVEGQTDIRDATGKSWQRHEWAGPGRDGIYGDSDQPLVDQWMYHAVADTILANSLLRSLPQVDANNVGVMGISWGGVITSTVIGVDNRFAFAIPTYGCGGLAKAQNQYGRALGQNTLYRDVWDPLVRMNHVTMPVLWLSWTGDQHFPLDLQSRCYFSAPGPHMVAFLPDMRHGHAPGWNPPDSYEFARSVVETGTPWCQQLGVKRENAGRVRVSFDSSKSVDRVMLVATTDTGFTGHRTWNETEAEFKQNQSRVIVDATLPQGTTAWFVSLHSGGLIASSDYQE